MILNGGKGTKQANTMSKEGYKRLLKVEIVGLVFVIVTVWGLLTLPLIFFYNYTGITLARYTLQDSTIAIQHFRLCLLQGMIQGPGGPHKSPPIFTTHVNFLPSLPLSLELSPSFFICRNKKGEGGLWDTYYCDCLKS